MKKKKIINYLMGYVVYYTNPNVRGDNTFYIEERIYQYSAPVISEQAFYHSDVYGFSCGISTIIKRHRIFKELRIKIYPSLEKAAKAAKLFKQTNNIQSPMFIRIWTYSTDNPKHAKGLRLMPINEQSIWNIS